MLAQRAADERYDTRSEVSDRLLLAMLLPPDLSFSARPKGNTFLSFDRIPPVAPIAALLVKLFADIRVPVLLLVMNFLFNAEEESVGHLQLPVFSNIRAFDTATINSPHANCPQKFAHSSALILRFGSVSSGDAPVNS